MSNIKQFFDKDGNDIFPVTHASAVFGDEGKTIQEEVVKLKNNNVELDNQSEIGALISNGRCRFFISDNIISLDNTLVLTNVENIVIEGVGKSSVIETTNGIVIKLINCHNITFRNLTIRSTGTGSNMYGALTIENGCNNISIENCLIESSCSNGVKILAESDYVDNVIFRDCVFSNIARMGVEAQNHKTVLGYGYRNIKIDNCVFDNIGTSGSNGMGVSLSGQGRSCVVRDCKFSKCTTIGIEGVGVSYSIFDNNLFIFEDKVYVPFSFSNNTTMINNVFRNNDIQNDNNLVLTNTFRNLNNCTFESNNFCGVSMRNVSNSIFFNNKYFTAGKYALYMENTSQNNRFLYDIYDNSICTSNYATIRIYTDDCINNLFMNYTIKQGTGGAAYDGEGAKYCHFVSRMSNTNYPVANNGDNHMSSYKLSGGFTTTKTRQLTISELISYTYRLPILLNIEIMALNDAGTAMDVLSGSVYAITLSNKCNVIESTLMSKNGRLTAKVHAQDDTIIIQINSTTEFRTSIGKISCKAASSSFKLTISDVDLVTF